MTNLIPWQMSSQRSPSVMRSAHSPFHLHIYPRTEYQLAYGPCWWASSSSFAWYSRIRQYLTVACRWRPHQEDWLASPCFSCSTNSNLRMLFAFLILSYGVCCWTNPSNYRYIPVHKMVLTALATVLSAFSVLVAVWGIRCTIVGYRTANMLALYRVLIL